MEKQNEEMKIQLACVQKALEIIVRKRHHSDQSGILELKNLWSAVPSPMAEPTIAIATELQNLKEELYKEKSTREELEQQLKENQEELMHIYIDAEVPFRSSFGILQTISRVHLY